MLGSHATLAALDKLFSGRRFQVYSIATKESLSDPATFNKTCDVLDILGEMNGMDIREVT